MYRYEVSESVKNDIEGVIGRPVFYIDDSVYYIDSPNEAKVFQYHDSGGEVVTKTLDQICTDLYSSDFDANSTQHEYKQIQEVQLQNIDPDTGMPSVSTKKMPSDWIPEFREMEFTTAKVASIHDKDPDNNDIGHFSLKFLDSSRSDLGTNQTNITTSCKYTVVTFDPNKAWAIRGAYTRQLAIPTSALYVWTTFKKVVAPGPIYLDLPYANGGLNMEFQAVRESVGDEGENYTIFAQGDKIEWLFEHDLGLQHRIRIIKLLGFQVGT